METNQIKLTELELQKIQELRNKYTTLTGQLGQLKIEQIIITNQIARLNELEAQLTKEYSDLQKEEESLAKTIAEKYGDGELDIETGVITTSKPTV